MTNQARHDAVVFGSVLSDPNDKPVADAEVLVSPGHSTRTNATGEFRIAGIAPGQYTVLVRHLGHTAISLPLTLAPGDTVARDFVLALGVAMLDTTRVSGRVMLRSGISLGKMAGFYDRRKQHIGNSVDSTVLENEKSQPLSEIFRSHFPIQVINMMGGAAAMASPRGMVVGALKGVEFFAGPGETPAQYSGTGASCGTLLLWTK